jgi:Trk K+ transport system NAD-binding subunit
MRQRGLQVIRAHIRDGSRLIGKSLSDVSNFRTLYKAAVVSIQKPNAKVQHESLLNVTFEVGDLLVLQVSDDSPLLESPPEGFYLQDESKRNSTYIRFSSGSPKMSDRNSDKNNIDGDVEESYGLKEKKAVWNDLEVFRSNINGGAAVQREFLIAMTVAKGSDLIGKTVAQGGIDKLPGLYLVSIDLDRHCIVPGSDPPVEAFLTVPFTEVLTEGDVLWFSGSASSVPYLRKIPGLSLYESGEVMQVNERVQDRRLVEAVVSRKGPLVGRTVKEVKFRTSYGAAVIAVHREGRRVHELPGNIKLQAGDVLLLEAGKSFIVANKNQYDHAFTLMAEVEGSSPPRFRMLIPAIVLTVSAYATYMAKLSSLFGTALAASILMVILGVLTEEEARASIRWEIYLTIAPAYGVGSALINSGVAHSMSSFLVRVGNGMCIGDAGILGSVYLSTVIMSQMIANNAAAAMIFPIAIGAAEAGGIDVVLMAFGIMLAASAAFMTPFGYQTNLIVYGPGGYKVWFSFVLPLPASHDVITLNLSTLHCHDSIQTTDYLKIGTPMQVALTVISTWALAEKKWWLVWLVSSSILAAVCIFRIVRDRKGSKGKHS